jgi:hypothetical protein
MASGELVASAGRLAGTALELARGEKEALRIQAAAVAAQQAALDDEEARLQQRRGSLEQQEEQLAAHLEEKRRRLEKQREETQAARLALQNEQTAYQETVERTRRDLTEAEKEVIEAREQARTERKRLIELRRRLKRRWHRQWLAERRAFREREQALDTQRRILEKDCQRLQQERADVIKERLRRNGEAELAKRLVQDEWDKLRQAQITWKNEREREQAELAMRARALLDSQTSLAQAQRDLAYDRHQWHGLRVLLEREVEGLDLRARNQRRKIVAQQQEIGQLDALLQNLRPPGSASLPVLVPVAVVPKISTPPADEPAPGALASSATATPGEPSSSDLATVGRDNMVEPVGGMLSPDDSPCEAENALQRRRTLDRLAGELADQRLQVAEHWARLAHTQQCWQQDHDAAAAELEALIASLPERERALTTQERDLQARDCDSRQRHEEALHLRQHLEAWQARLQTREGACEAERDRLFSELRSREEAAQQLETTLMALRQRWARRRRQELEQLRQQRADCEKLRKEWVAFREDWWRRTTILEEQRRVLAEKELALERHRQEYQSGTEDPAATDRAVERLRRRWLRLNAAAVRATTEGRQKLQEEAVQLEAHYKVIQRQNEALSQREANLAEQMATLQQRETLARIQEVRFVQELQQLRSQRDRYEQQTGELQGQVDHLAQLLMEGPSHAILPVSQGAHALTHSSPAGQTASAAA